MRIYIWNHIIYWTLFWDEISLVSLITCTFHVSNTIFLIASIISSGNKNSSSSLILFTVNIPSLVSVSIRWGCSNMDSTIIWGILDNEELLVILIKR